MPDLYLNLSLRKAKYALAKIIQNFHNFSVVIEELFGFRNIVGKIYSTTIPPIL